MADHPHTCTYRIQVGKFLAITPTMRSDVGMITPFGHFDVVKSFCKSDGSINYYMTRLVRIDPHWVYEVSILYLDKLRAEKQRLTPTVCLIHKEFSEK